MLVGSWYDLKMLSTHRIFLLLVHRWPLVILLLLLLLATVLRLWQLAVLPPGLFYDEALNGIDARRLLTGGELALYFPANNGREPLYFYLQAISVLLFGPNAFALRLVSALIGVATVAAIYHLAKTVFVSTARRENDGQGSSEDAQRRVQILNWVALIAAAVVAVSFWHLSLSRLAFRAILLPLISALAFSAFWVGWHDGNRRAWIWAGVALAVAAYTYTAARLLPLVLVTFVLVEVGIDAIRLRAAPRRLVEIYKPQLHGLFLMTTIALLLLMPLVWAFVTQPGLLNGRTEQVSIFSIAQGETPSTVLQRLGDNVQVALRSFYNAGDQNLRHNLPGRSINDAALAVLFSLGLFAAAQGILKAARHRLLLIWLVVMLMPTVFSNLAPHALRSVGVLPPLALLSGAGAGWVLQRTSRMTTLHRAGGGLLLIVVLGSGSLSTYDYFVRWAGQAQLGAHFDLERYLAAQRVAEWLNSDEQSALLLSQALYQTPQMRFVVGELPRQDLSDGASVPNEQVVLNITAVPDMGNRQATFLLHKHEDGVVASWREPRAADMLTSASIDRAQVIRWPLIHTQWPILMESPLRREGQTLPVPRQIAHPLAVTFENGMKLVGYEITEGTTPWHNGRGFHLVTFWERTNVGAVAQQAQDFDAFVHLYNDGVLSQSNGPLGNHLTVSLWTPDFPVSLWAQDTVVESRHFLPIPSSVTPGKAHFELGLVNNSTGQSRIGIVDGAGQVSAGQVDFGAVMINAEASQAETGDLCPFGVRFDEQIELLGGRIAFTSEQPNQLEVALGWRALTRPQTDVTAFVHFLNEEGEIVSQHDQPPGGVENPSSLWAPGERVRSTFALALPMEDKVTTLRIGLYEPVSGRQLPVTPSAVPVKFTLKETYILLHVQATAPGAPCQSRQTD